VTDSGLSRVSDDFKREESADHISWIVSNYYLVPIPIVMLICIRLASSSLSFSSHEGRSPESAANLIAEKQSSGIGSDGVCRIAVQIKRTGARRAGRAFATFVQNAAICDRLWESLNAFTPGS
jgi:hypothetical protein